MPISESYDVIVLGSGAAGLTAAFTAAHEGARVAVFEKHGRIGGTSAWSGGHVWIPNNPHMADIGAADSTEDAMAYLTALGRGLVGVAAGGGTGVPVAAISATTGWIVVTS